MMMMVSIMYLVHAVPATAFSIVFLPPFLPVVAVVVARTMAVKTDRLAGPAEAVPL
jgi:hypothetical protein